MIPTFAILKQAKGLVRNTARAVRQLPETNGQLTLSGVGVEKGLFFFVSSKHWSGRQFDPQIVTAFLEMPANLWKDLRNCS
jgi:hypothetical protein